MNASNATGDNAAAAWFELLGDEDALLMRPGSHHRKLVEDAYALHRAQVIGRDDLSDLLERADGALAYVVEALLDGDNGQ
ncbi:hypothetical protein [Pseudomonas capeferrum]